MRAPRIPADEQYRLIMECRASGLTDYEWCLQHDIKPGTFYNWVKRLRRKGCEEIPKVTREPIPRKQEVVKIELPVIDTSSNTVSVLSDQGNSYQQEQCMELSVAGAILRIPNGTDPTLLRQTLYALKELTC